MPPRADQVSIPAAWVRGGSSNAVFYHEKDIPPEGPLRDRMLKRVMGTPDPIQIDGLGGSKAVTSKIAIIRPSERSDADIDYIFAQSGVKLDDIDYTANCGNSMFSSSIESSTPALMNVNSKFRRWTIRH